MQVALQARDGEDTGAFLRERAGMEQAGKPEAGRLQ
jgi:hypothetical protein